VPQRIDWMDYSSITYGGKGRSGYGSCAMPYGCTMSGAVAGGLIDPRQASKHERRTWFRSEAGIRIPCKMIIGIS